MRTRHLPKLLKLTADDWTRTDLPPAGVIRALRQEVIAQAEEVRRLGLAHEAMALELQREQEPTGEPQTCGTCKTFKAWLLMNPLMTSEAKRVRTEFMRLHEPAPPAPPEKA